jgi:hypothetical protein
MQSASASEGARYGLSTLPQTLDDSGELNETDKHEIQCVEATEDASKSHEPGEQTLDLFAPAIRRLLICAELQAC